MLCKEPAVKYAAIEKAAGRVSVSTACRLLSVRRQGYYEYQNRKGSQRGVQDRVLTTKIKDVFYENRRIYGARKIQEKLREDGWWISRKRIRRLMDRAGLTPVSWRRRVQTTVSDPQASPFPNLLKQDFSVALPNQTWASDFTYVFTDEGWLYLCIFIDLFSRRVVGWAVSSSIDRQLAIAAFRNAVANRRPGQRLVIHTDRGCQYTSWDFRREVASIGGLQSMSRPGTPYDNACAETFFRTLKAECVDRAHFRSRKDASDAIAEYLLFYNRRRIHQSLGYLTPVAFEQLFAA
ncbi:MAG: IS3 family transposase [Eubacteriales bacterium]|nr:IS3 family transposase [Eubacteriales bacterium]